MGTKETIVLIATIEQFTVKSNKFGDNYLYFPSSALKIHVRRQWPIGLLPGWLKV